MFDLLTSGNEEFVTNKTGNTEFGDEDIANIVAASEEVSTMYKAIEALDETNTIVNEVEEAIEDDKEVINGNEEVTLATARHSAKVITKLNEELVTAIDVKLKVNGSEDMSDPKSVVVAASEGKADFVKAMYEKAAAFIAGLIRKIKTGLTKLYASTFTKEKALKSVKDTIEKNDKGYSVSKDAGQKLFDSYPLATVKGSTLKEFLDNVKNIVAINKDADKLIKDMPVAEVGMLKKGAAWTKDVASKFTPISDSYVTSLKDKITKTKKGIFSSPFTDKAEAKPFSFTLKSMRLIVTEITDDKLKAKQTSVNFDNEVKISGDTVIAGRDLNPLKSAIDDAIEMSSNIKNYFEKATSVSEDIKKKTEELINKGKTDGFSDDIKQGIAFNKVNVNLGFGAALDVYKTTGQVLDIAKQVTAKEKGDK